MEEEILDEIQKKISELNSALYKAASNNIQINIIINSYGTMGAIVTTPTLTFEAFKKLTPNYIQYTGGM